MSTARTIICSQWTIYIYIHISSYMISICLNFTLDSYFDMQTYTNISTSNTQCQKQWTTSFGSSQPSWWKRRTCRTWKLLSHHILGNAPQCCLLKCFAWLLHKAAIDRNSANRSGLSYKRLPAASEELPHVRESYCASWSPDLQGNRIYRLLTTWVFPKKNRGTPKWMVYNGKPY